MVVVSEKDVRNNVISLKLYLITLAELEKNLIENSRNLHDFHEVI